MSYQSKLKEVFDFKKVKTSRCVAIRVSLSYSMPFRKNRQHRHHGKAILDLLWSIFTGEPVDFGSILWDDLLSYVGRNQPRQGLTDVTSARFWSLCIKDLHSTTNISLGAYINFFVCRKHKRYSLPKDQTIFGPIRQLPLHILTKVGLITKLVSGLMEATNDVPPYRSIPPSPS